MQEKIRKILDFNIAGGKMKTSKNKSAEKRLFKASYYVLPFLLAGLMACSSGEDAIEYSYSKHYGHDNQHDSFNIGRNGFSFKESGDWYKVKFRDGEIYKLYVNGDRIPSDEIYKYEDLIYDKKDELKESLADLKGDWDDFDFDMHEFRKDMSEFKYRYKDEIKRAMKELKRELKHADFGRIRADVDLDELHESLAELNNINIDLDMDDFNRSMADLSENLSNIKVEISDRDWDEFRDEMNSLKDELRNLDIDMSDLKFEMKKIKRFMKDCRRELVDDGYLEYGDDDFDMEFNKNELIINGRRLPDDLLPKYKRMYKEHFGREIDTGINFRD